MPDIDLEMNRLGPPAEAKKMDRRVRKTRQRLQTGLLLLMKEKPLSQITMREICRRADVGRSTPYTHYRDVEDILEQMEGALYDATAVLLPQYPAGAKAGQIAWLTAFYALAQRNGLLLEVLLCHDGDPAFLCRLLSLCEEGVAAVQAADAPYGDWRVSFVTGGLTAMVRQWVRGGCTESPEELARMTLSFLRGD